MSEPALPLSGVRILSIEQFGAGPFGTLALTNLGAEVIKIEEPVSGDVSREVGGYTKNAPADVEPNLYFQALNVGKKSLSLDLKSDAGREVFEAMASSVDAVCSNLRGDVVGKLGLGYDRLGPLRPQIVCAHLTAYGRDDKRRAWPGYDYIMQAEAGYTSVTGDPGMPPTRFGLSIVDWMGGLSLAIGLLAGIVNARATGIGGDVDVNLFDVALYNLNYVGVWQMNAGYRPQRLPRGAHPSQGPAQMCQTADGWMYIMASKEKFWRSLCVLIGHPEFIEDARFRTAADREKHRDELTPLLDAALGARTSADWMDRFAGVVPAAPVLDVEEALSTPYVQESGRIVEVPFGDGEALRVLRGPIQWNRTGFTPEPAPRLGRDTAELLTGIGYDPDRIAALRADGVV